MEFKLDRCEKLPISDKEIFDLLSEVYVTASFTTEEVAKKVFEPGNVRNRGVLFAAREVLSDEFSGMVIVVPPKSNAVVRAKSNECELHLLGVKTKYRGYGLGRKLVYRAIEYAGQNNWSKMILWTQKPMKEAQNLYASCGFLKTDEMTKNGIDFYVYEREEA